MADTVPRNDAGDNTPVLLIGGAENAVSCARRFTEAGITTVVVNSALSPALRTRGVVKAPIGPTFAGDALRAWLEGAGRQWSGSVAIPLSDRALHTMAANYDALSEHYRLPLLDPALVAAMLDKQVTLELAAEAGIAAPRQWIPTSTGAGDVLAELTYPLILKPRHGFELIAATGAKYLRAENEAELLAHLPIVESLPSGFVLNEFLVGPDDLLSSYYALRSSDGSTLLEFTKRVDRRCPPNKGGATFHELIDLPETAKIGRRFFDHVGLVGLGNVEFKADAETGELKIIECNYRLTAATALMQDNGLDIAGAVYRQALGLEPMKPERIGWGGTMWYPVRDLNSFRMSGDGLRRWLRRPKRSSFPYWRLSDPGPSLRIWRTAAGRYLNRLRTPPRGGWARRDRTVRR